MFYIPITIFIVFTVQHIQAVSFITKCKSDDWDCYKKSANAALPTMAVGVPEYGINAVDPMFIKEIDMSSPNLKLIVHDATMVGFKNTKIINVKHDKANSKLHIKWIVNVQMDGQYEMDGNLLVLSLKGKGPIHVSVRKMEVSVTVDMKEVDGKDGLKHWQIKSPKTSFIMKDTSSTVVFENLFQENDVLATAAKEVIAASGSDIIAEVGKPMVDFFVSRCAKEINHFFEAVPISELSLD